MLFFLYNILDNTRKGP